MLADNVILVSTTLLSLLVFVTPYDINFDSLFSIIGLYVTTPMVEILTSQFLQCYLDSRTIPLFMKSVV